MAEGDPGLDIHELNERLRREQQADSEANRLAIEQLKERLGYPPARVAQQRRWRPVRLIELASVLYVLIALERLILTGQTSADTSMICFFIAVDLFGALLLLQRLWKPGRPPRVRSSTTTQA
jgi:hypothetical protein